MRYRVKYLQMPKRGGFPANLTSSAGAFLDETGLGLVPSVGDYVIVGADVVEGSAEIRGRVRTRLFRYPEEGVCEVSIVLMEDDGDWRLVSAD